jgi:uncharacterized membrane protein YhaH (DUF805 family)
MDWIWYLFRFGGRINRALLWQALLIVAVLAALLGIFGQIINGIHALKVGLTIDIDFGLDDLFKVVDPRAYHSLASFDRVALILKALGLSLFLWIYLATAIKRLHDRDRSGWWIVPFFVVPTLFSQFSDLLPDSNWMLPFSLAASGLWLWGLVELFCLRGSAGDNRFGPDPLAEIEDEARRARTPAWDQQSELEMVPHRASPPRAMS